MSEPSSPGKELRPPAEWPIVEVEWLDSIGSARWRELGELLELQDDRFLRHHSIGYLVQETDESVLLLGSFQDEIDDGATELSRNVEAGTKIPKVAIVSRTELRRR
jgi:hypothetical protein